MLLVHAWDERLSKDSMQIAQGLSQSSKSYMTPYQALAGLQICA